ncbi:sigma factor-like helix-turn-helix DNA-binding protein, partial [Polymorphospora rubra]|uniref:sigma factor-like helix-turn-helix DNA-binding protein n=1 Tax=Polymorphospora rubra TaxID=338584 RepID=UPI0033E11831
LTEVASRFSLSRERIRQLEIQALGRLRELRSGRGARSRRRPWRCPPGPRTGGS